MDEFLYCRPDGSECNFDEWEKHMMETGHIVDIGEVETKDKKDKFVVFTRFEGLLIGGEKNKECFQTTVDLPTGVKYNPKNPNHVKYYNKKFKLKTKKNAKDKDKDVKDKIKKDKDL